MQEPSDARLCEFCGYTLTPACGSNIEARGCHFYRKVHYGEGESVEDASPRDIFGTHAAISKAYSGEPTLGPLSPEAKLNAKPHARDLGEALEQLAEYEADYTAREDAVTLPPHYTRWKIEPIFFIEENRMPFWMGNIIKYVTRADAKNGIEDLRKARRYIDMKIKQLGGDPNWAK